MATSTQERVYDLLGQIPDRGLPAVKELFWTELNYERANESLSYRVHRERLTGKGLLTMLTEIYYQHGLNTAGACREASEGENDALPRIVCSEGLV